MVLAILFAVRYYFHKLFTLQAAFGQSTQSECLTVPVGSTVVTICKVCCHLDQMMWESVDAIHVQQHIISPKQKQTERRKKDGVPFHGTSNFYIWTAMFDWILENSTSHSRKLSSKQITVINNSWKKFCQHEINSSLYFAEAQFCLCQSTMLFTDLVWHVIRSTHKVNQICPWHMEWHVLLSGIFLWGD